MSKRMSELHKIKTPEGFEGWQWENGPVFVGDLARGYAIQWGAYKEMIAELEYRGGEAMKRARKEYEARLTYHHPNEDEVKCPKCLFSCHIHWLQDGEGGPWYCPRCGEHDVYNG
jgi:hypothetical protein